MEYWIGVVKLLVKIIECYPNWKTFPLVPPLSTHSTFETMKRTQNEKKKHETLITVSRNCVGWQIEFNRHRKKNVTFDCSNDFNFIKSIISAVQ